MNRTLRRLSLIHQRVQPRYNQTHPFVSVAEDFKQSIADDGIYSFSMFLVHNSGPCMPLTVPKLRDLLLRHGILTCIQIHEQYPDLTHPQFNYQELSALLYFLYTNKLNPEFYRGRMLPYGVTQQITQLVLYQTYYMFLAATFRCAHFIVWAKINIARFQPSDIQHSLCST